MKKILFILISLIIILAFLISLMNKTKVESDGLSLKIGDEERIISYSTFGKMEKVNFQTERGDEYSGYQLLPLLHKNGMNECKYLTLFSEDGGSLRLNEIDHADAYLIWQSDTEKPGLRLIISSDEFGQRWMKNLIAIEIHN